MVNTYYHPHYFHMDSLLQTVNSFKQKRHDALTLCNNIKNTEKNTCVQESRQLQKNRQLTDEEFEQFYTETIIKTQKEQYTHVYVNHEQYFDSLVKYSDNDVNENCKYRECSSKDQYINCINKIKSMGIDIVGVTQTFNKDNSYDDKPHTVYIFNCVKGNYKFDVVYTMMRRDSYFRQGPDIEKIINIKTQNEIEVRCNLYYDYAVEIENFLNLINEVDLDGYIEEKFGHFIKLVDLLKCKGFNVNCEYEKPTSSNKFWMKLDVKNEKGTCIIIPQPKSVYSTQYYLHIFPTFNEIIKNVHNSYKNMKEIKLKSFHQIKNTPHYTFKYDSGSDLPELLKCINAFLNHMSGNYGYFNSSLNKFQNDHQIVKYCSDIKKKMDDEYKIEFLDRNRGFQDNMISEFVGAASKLTIKTYVDNYNGPYINTLIIYHPVHGTITYYDGMEYLVDFYGIRFMYTNSQQNNPWNKNKCVLTVEGKFYGATKYKCSDGNNIFTIENLGELYRFEGTFDQCFDKLKDVLDKIIAIND